MRLIVEKASMVTEMKLGLIFAIKKYAIHDGPNIRTTVFLKGCPLRCEWCHNPEGIDSVRDMLWSATKCLGCRACIEKCSRQALEFRGGILKRSRDKCALCGECGEICPAMAHEETGWYARVEDILAEIEKDILFYDHSGGGVTFSGGEPLMQSQFLLDLLRGCEKMSIHRTVDTTCHGATEMVLEIAEHTDLFLIDLKHMESSKHKAFTGVENTLILHNIKELDARGSEMIIRIPLVNGFNCEEKNIIQSAKFIQTLRGVTRVELLPYHSLGITKYSKLNKQAKCDSFAAPSAEQVAVYEMIFRQNGIEVQRGG